MTASISSIPGLKNKFDKCTQEVCEFFKHISNLLNEFPLEVCLTYVFSTLEKGQNNALYCGAVKLYQTDAELTWKAISIHRIERKDFVEFYRIIFGLQLPKNAYADLKSAEEIRDKIMHGKTATDKEIRNAIAKVLEFAEEVNKQLSNKYGLKPFGNLRGFSGASRKSSKKISRFILKGMGFAI